MPATRPTTARAVDDSVVSRVRRRQLVESAIAVIAEHGFDRASVVKIAAHAGVSRGVFAYHFADIDDLHDAVLATVYELGRAALEESVTTADGPRGSLLAFVGGSVQFYADHPTPMLAVREIFLGRRRSATGSRDRSALHAAELDKVADLLREGQAQGAFRPFDATFVAELVRAMLDAALNRVVAGATGRVRSRAQVTAVRRELVAAVDALTAAEPRSSDRRVADGRAR